MPPGPAYNWFCALYSATEILGHAARYRASQVAPRATAAYANPRKRRRTEDATGSSPTVLAKEPVVESAVREDLKPLQTPIAPVMSKPTYVQVEESRMGVDAPAASSTEPKLADDAGKASEKAGAKLSTSAVPQDPKVEPGKNLDALEPSPTLVEPVTISLTSPGLGDGPTPPRKSTSFGATTLAQEDVQELPIQPLEPLLELTQPTPIPISRNLQSSKVPSSRIGRLFHYGGLAASLGYGAATEIIRRTGSGSQEGQTSVMMTEANIKRLVSKLSQMRGAALKLGQFMSIQDTHVLPPEIDKIFRRVQDSAHYMPDWQMEQVMTSALGSSWLNNFTSFDRIPFAAASIGQVHKAVLAASASPTGREEPVAVKIQFPNIVNSIESDLGYIKLLLTAGSLMPKGLFLDKTIQVMKAELADECDYIREASFLRMFGSADCLGDDPRFKVPWVWDGSTATVLVMERVNGVSVGEADASNLSTQDRNDISARIIELCLKELFHFRAMQTDPNWTNFLWNAATRQVELVDFGATRVYEKGFMDQWLRLLQAAASGDREACREWSLKLGYLTGEEDERMLNAHITSMTLLATPFKAETPQPFNFGQGTRWAEITAEIREQIPVMLQHRLTPPPKETYSLNRKLSGSFLLASRLGATIDTKAIWDKVVEGYRFR